MLRLCSISIAAAAAVFAAGGCERQGEPAAASGGTAGADAAMIVVDKNAPLPTSFNAEAIAPLARNRPTMLAAMPDGSIYVVQSPPAGEAERDRNDVLVIRPDAHAAQPSSLTADAVMKALNVDPKPAANGAPPATRPRVIGQFTAIAARSDGKLAFAFGGIADNRPFFAIGTFDPAATTPSAALFVPVDHLTIAAAGDADVPTDPSRQNLFTAGDDAWLWRATDREMRLIAIHNLSDADPKLSTKRLALDHVRDAAAANAAQAGPDTIQRGGWEWSATSDRGHFLLTDRASRWIRQIDENGDVTHVARFEADAVASLSAAAEDAAGRVIVLGCDRDGIAQSLLVQDGETFKSLPAASFHVDAALIASRLQLDRLLPVPKSANTFVSYDGVTGNVVRVTLK